MPRPLEIRQWFTIPENLLEIEAVMIGRLEGLIKKRYSWLVEPGTTLKMEFVRDPETNVPTMMIQFQPQDPDQQEDQYQDEPDPS